jgi:hypothetical protein
MKVTIEGNELVVRIPVKDKPFPPSSTGVTLTVASTGGFTQTGLMVEGQPLKLNLQACIKPK